MLQRFLAFVLLALFATIPFASAAPDPYEINVILPLTGAAAFLAKEEVASLGVVEKQINASGGIKGQPIKFVYLDDQTNPQQAVVMLNQVIAKHVPVVLGSTLVAMCNAMAALVKDNGPVMYCFSPGNYPPAGSYEFVASYPIADYFVGAMRYFRDKKLTRIAFIGSTDATGQDGENNVNAALQTPEGKGVEVIEREHFNPTDMSMTAQLARIKASNAQALIAWVSGTGFGTLLHSMSDVGLTIPTLASSANLIYAQLDGYKGFIGNNIIFPAVPGDDLEGLPRGRLRDAVASYMTAMKAAGIRPDQGHTLSYDPALLVVEALRKLGTNATATQIRDYLMNVKGWTGINGTYDFAKYPQRGIGGSGGIVIVRWDTEKGTWVPLSAPGGLPLK